MSKYYITTPIYYVNDAPHIGHSYTTVAADTIARYHRAIGDDVIFLTGSDEHGAKIAEAAHSHGKSPKAYADEISAQYQSAWQSLEITNDRFVRTTDKCHEEAVQVFLTKLYEKGQIYKSSYEGLYCVGCERFMTEDELAGGLCPDHRVAPIRQVEENYFFRLSNYQDRLLRAIQDENDPNHFDIAPVSRRNEVIGKLNLGLNDISISRAALNWGIPIPFDPKQTVYVWVDALLSYISGIGYYDDQPQFNHYWPANLHLMAKDILWFHAVIWPAMLMALDLRPPLKVFAHGFFTVDGQKMSKTLGNVLRPADLIQRFGVDASRYLMLSEFPSGSDGDLSINSFIERYNANLANDLGNLVNRTISMINRYYGGELPVPSTPPDDPAHPEDIELMTLATAMPAKVAMAMDAVAFLDALSPIWAIISRANRYVEETAPWSLAKNDRNRLNTVMYNLAEAVRFIAHGIWPFMPGVSEAIAELLGCRLCFGTEQARGYTWGFLQPGTKVSAPRILFPRIEVPK